MLANLKRIAHVHYAHNVYVSMVGNFWNGTLWFMEYKMKSLLHVLLLAACFVSLLPSCHARDFTFTVMVEAGKSDCFYDYIHKGAFLEVEYQVCFYYLIIM